MTVVKRITWSKLDDLIDELAPKLRGEIVYGIPRGGAIVAGIARQRIPSMRLCTDPKSATVLLDDVIETGKTIKLYQNTWNLGGRVSVIALFDKMSNPQLVGTWIHFPWEREDRIQDELVRFGYECEGGSPAAGQAKSKESGVR